MDVQRMRLAQYIHCLFTKYNQDLTPTFEVQELLQR